MRIITIHSMCDENHKLFRREQIVHAKDSKVRQIKLNCSLLYTIYVHLNAHSQNLYRFDSISSIDLRISFPFCYFRFLCAKIARKKFAFIANLWANVNGIYFLHRVRVLFRFPTTSTLIPLSPFSLLMWREQRENCYKPCLSCSFRYINKINCLIVERLSGYTWVAHKVAQV